MMLRLNWPLFILVFVGKLIFAQDTLPHVVFLAGEEEYGAHWTLPKIADDLERRFNIRSTVIHSWRSGAHDYDMPGKVDIPEFEEIKNLKIIEQADLLVMHIRFRLPPQEQLDMFQAYFDAGKPAIAFRTTSHGMWAADQKDWFVHFFGGHYKGHMPNTQGTTTIVPSDQIEHPILRGVPKMNAMNDVMGIYIAAPLNSSATPLMMGKTGLVGPAQPVTWVNEYQPGQKIFYTSLGGLESFVDPGFINMVYNAVFWALDRPVPEHGVLGIDNLSFWEKEPPFERFAFGALNENPFEKAEEELALGKTKILDGHFQSIAIPPPPQPNIPDDAIILFDGKDLSKWRHWDLSSDPPAMLPDARAVSPSPDFPTARWNIIDGALEARPGYGSILTRESYGNYRLHFDFLIPPEPDYVPDQYRGSGGIFLDGRYEIKLLDSHNKEASSTGNGSIFGQKAPDSNPSKPVNTWQSMDIEFKKFKGQKPIVSVWLNAVKIHDEVQIMNRSPFAIREEGAFYKSSITEARELFDLSREDWLIDLDFRTTGEGYLFSNAPESAPWNEASRGLLIRDGMLVYRLGVQYKLISEASDILVTDGKWHKIVVANKSQTVVIYLDGQELSRFPNQHNNVSEGHIFRIGQGAKIHRLGASDLPDPYDGELFSGEIKKMQFYKGEITERDMELIVGAKSSVQKDPQFTWKTESENNVRQIQMGPIRIQSDLSKIRYANMWLQKLTK